MLCACGALDGPAAETPVRAGAVTHNCERILQRLAWYIIETELFLNQQCCCVESVYGTKCTSSSCLFLFFSFLIEPAHFAAGKEEGKKTRKGIKEDCFKPPLSKSSGRLQTIWQVRHHRFVGSEREKEKEKFLQWDRDGANNCVSQLMTVHAVALGSQKSCGCCALPVVELLCYTVQGKYSSSPSHHGAARIPLHLKFNPSASAKGF